jgi:hypothetical protein
LPRAQTEEPLPACPPSQCAGQGFPSKLSRRNVQTSEGVVVLWRSSARVFARFVTRRDRCCRRTCIRAELTENPRSLSESLPESRKKFKIKISAPREKVSPRSTGADTDNSSPRHCAQFCAHHQTLPSATQLPSANVNRCRCLRLSHSVAIRRRTQWLLTWPHCV